MFKLFIYLSFILLCEGIFFRDSVTIFDEQHAVVAGPNIEYHILSKRDLPPEEDIVPEIPAKNVDKGNYDGNISTTSTTITKTTTINYDVSNVTVSPSSLLNITSPPVEIADNVSVLVLEEISSIDNTTTSTTTSATVVKPVQSDNETLIINTSGLDPQKVYIDHESIIMSNDTKKVDHHRYYQSYFARSIDEAESYWVDLDKAPSEKVISHDMLSDAHRRALTVSLSFNFPFYGHILNNITIATGGFLFTGAFLHKWLAATQYIAPLMANFDTSMSDNAIVKYADNGTSLTVQWENVVLQDNPNIGSFTFQVTIHQTGGIVFAYKDVPVTVTLIKDSNHPVKVGLSDAYIVEKTVFYVRKKTIYEYHKIDLKTGTKIANWSAIVFEPLPNCVAYNNCESCLSAVTAFQCQWCNQIGHCSDGVDRQRQDWLEGKCAINSVVNISICAGLPDPPRTTRPPPTIPRWSDGAGSVFSDLVNGDLSSFSRPRTSVPNDSGGNGGLVAFIVIICLLLSCVGWMAYAYFHPHTSSGQLLIKYRPSTWSCRRGHARYTAATMHSIHM